MVLMMMSIMIGMSSDNSIDIANDTNSSITDNDNDIMMMEIW